MDKPFPTIAILGASGLIGEAIASQLSREGFPVVPIARRFNSAQKAVFGTSVVERPIVDLNADALGHIFTENKIDIIINCIGVLQDSPRGSTDAAHRDFVERLTTLLGSRSEHTLLIHISIPGKSEDDRTSFSRTKREGERVIKAGHIPFIILQPGFVIAPAAYGGSALMRALAVLPVNLSPREAEQSLAVTDVTDIAQTIAIVARRWRDGVRDWNAVWEVMARQLSTVGDVIDAFQHRLGGPKRRMSLPSWLIGSVASAGDLITQLGWSPPIRSTALREMRRGVTGNPEAWIAATNIEPASLRSTLQRVPANVQEKWFARLYLAKALILASLVVFWAFSGLIALTLAFGAATEILTSHGLTPILAKAITTGSSLVDISVGLAIAFRKTCRSGLLAGVGVSLFYMISATVVTPEMWIEPLGALVKTGPAIVLMVVAFAILEDR